MSEALRWAVAASPIGPLAVCVSERGVKALLVADDEAALERSLARQFPSNLPVRDQAGLVGTLAEIDKIWQTPPGAPALELDPVGTEFQRAVWEQLRKIPRGTTITYGELARRTGNPKAARAVARACGANPILVLIPCHRVVGSDGSLTGFAAGVHRKKALLERENPPLA
jgi:AraC family transcriptional regulator, regulatory protein of adaptative response / methylated-DNA-[protein]-cysteine methyltransferase